MIAKIGMRFNFLTETKNGIINIPLTVTNVTSMVVISENTEYGAYTRVPIKMFSKLVKKEMVIN